MPGAEERDLGGEGAVHVSVAGLGGGCMCTWAWGRARGQVGIWAEGNMAGTSVDQTEQALGLLPRALASGEPCGPHAGMMVFCGKSPSLLGHLCGLGLSFPAQLSVSEIIITGSSGIEIEQGPGASYLKCSPVCEG